jgi:hypothetical protein
MEAVWAWVATWTPWSPTLLLSTLLWIHSRAYGKGSGPRTSPKVPTSKISHPTPDEGLSLQLTGRGCHSILSAVHSSRWNGIRHSPVVTVWVTKASGLVAMTKRSRNLAFSGPFPCHHSSRTHVKWPIWTLCFAPKQNKSLYFHMSFQNCKPNLLGIH